MTDIRMTLGAALLLDNLKDEMAMTDKTQPLTKSFKKDTTLPACMMPDGAEPCRGYSQLQATIKEQAEEIEQLTQVRAAYNAQRRLCAAAEECLQAYDMPSLKDAIKSLEAGG